MKKHVKNGFWNARRWARFISGLALLAAASVSRADDLAAARFRGAPTYDFGVTNVTWEAATPEYSTVTFDLSWSYSWRAKWTEPAATSATGKDLEFENWDAAWVFVKFLPEKESEEAKERNHWLHATLDSDAAHHVMPAGATSTVKLSDDGIRGMGVFIYRDKIGNGRNDWKGIKLRWMHGMDKVDPAKSAIAVYPIAMVYVPEGPFKMGIVAKSGFAPFADGPDTPITRYDGEQSFSHIPEGLRKIIETTTSKDGGPYLQWEADPSWSRLTDGGWRGGPMIPFLLDAEWNAPVASGLRARRVGPVAGQLWSTHGFSERGGGGGMFGGQIGGNIPLTDAYPTGYDAFYCMKYDLTQGQYVDFLNALPPDVAAGRAFTGSEVSSDAGLHTAKVKVDLGSGRGSFTVTEMGGCTILSSADMPETGSTGPMMGGQPAATKQNDLDDLLADTFEDIQTKGSAKTARRPVYMARCPFRRLLGMTGTDTRAYAVWAGLRPMSALESTKAGVGARDPAAPADSASPPDLSENPVLLDAGLPTERYAKGNSRYGCDIATRVGCRSTPTSDRGTALATYWGISELGGPAIPLASRGFRGMHGNGTSPAGKPGASVKRVSAPFNDTPPDWPDWGAYTSGHFVGGSCRLVVSADNQIKKPVSNQDKAAVAAPVARPVSEPERADRIKVVNVKWEAGSKDSSTVSFDLSWDNSWRAKWEEPADKNVTGKPITVESWDAAWVFVKFRPAGAQDDSHAILSGNAKEHQVPAGAAIEIGASDDGATGVGVFVYRSAPGVGANTFKNVRVRWIHGDKVNPGQVELKVHAIGMVYIPEGPFASRSPWGHALKTITTPNATKPGGHLDSGPETVPLNDEWPNGYPAFYCMKYSITQGQYADFLNSIPSGNYNGDRYSVLATGNYIRYSGRLYNFNGYTITTNAAGMFKADVPDRRCNLLSLPDILSFTAWTGLRLPTNLEYEKACRGPRAVARGADAWTPATCAPAAGLEKSVLDNTSATGPGPSYWGIRELSLSGCLQEWPALIQNERAAEGQKGVGVEILGVHGNGSPVAPKEWPWGAFGEWYYGGIWRIWGYGTVGHWINVSELNNIPWETMDANRTGRYGARAVRTASVQVDPNAPLQINEPPKLTEADIGIFYLTGTFRNDGAKPLKVEIVTPLPDACFPGGAAARALTAAPKAATSIKILTALTHDNAKASASRGMWMPIRIQTPGGDVLFASVARMPMIGSLTATPVIQSLEGGAVTLRLINATDSTQTLKIELVHATVRADDPIRTIQLAAGAEARAAFTIPPQPCGTEGSCQIPYRVTVADGAPQDGSLTVDMRIQTRWWINRRVESGAQMAGEIGDIDDFDAPGAFPGMAELVSYDNSVFKTDKPPKGWTRATHGATLVFGDAGKLPTTGSAILAATRVVSPAERDARVTLFHDQGKSLARFVFTIWFNDAVVFRTGSDKNAETKPFHIRKTGNTLVVECRSADDVAVTPGVIHLNFTDATDDQPVRDLILNMDGAEKAP